MISNEKAKGESSLMLKGFILLLFIGAGVAACYFLSKDQHTVRQEAQKDYYTCPMHPQVHSDTPGDCPICEMKLVLHSTLRSSTPGNQTDTSESGIDINSLSAIRANISTFNLTPRKILSELVITGSIEIAEPNERLITARTRGRVEKLYVKETGGAITKGMPLYEYYSPDLSSNVAQYIIAKGAQTHSATHEHGGSHQSIESSARQRLKLYGLTDEQIDAYATAGVAPQTFTIYASASGTVIKKNVLEGSWLDEGTMLFQVADLSEVWAECDLPQSDLGVVRVGQSVAVSTSIPEDAPAIGKIVFISPVLSDAARTARIRVLLGNKNMKFKIQMAVQARIAISTSTELAVPMTAILHTGETSIVWVKESDGMFYPKRVTLGMLGNDNYQAVLSGLEEGDEVATNGTFLIDSEHQLQTDRPNSQ